jgi:putative nucleotidyltransferase with HDIG domain
VLQMVEAKMTSAADGALVSKSQEADGYRNKYEREAAERVRADIILEALSHANRSIVSAQSKEAIAKSVCDRVAETTKYPLVWFGRCVEIGEEKFLLYGASSGIDAAVVKGLRFSWDSGEVKPSPITLSIKTGNLQTTLSPPEAFEDVDARLAVYPAALVLPVIFSGVVYGVFVFHSRDEDAFGVRETEVFRTLALDISYALAVVDELPRLEAISKDRDSAHQRIQRLISNAVMALASVVEQRDPYTAGHQKRVSEIATAIGRELKLPVSQIGAISMAGLVHDIGKISVPSEVLSRPGKLSPVEMNMVKEHVESGYEILSKIEFDQPIARIVREHHERLDGSGYPKGLKGDEITLEARVIAVADAVEAISSHRPYRPALGLTRAKAVLTADRGKAYDADVVDAFLRVADKQPALFDTTTKTQT